MPEWFSTLSVYDRLPPRVRKALREANRNLSEETASFQLATGKSEDAVIEAILRADREGQ